MILQRQEPQQKRHAAWAPPEGAPCQMGAAFFPVRPAGVGGCGQEEVVPQPVLLPCWLDDFAHNLELNYKNL